MSFTGSVEDRLAIRERIEAYADAVFRRDGDDWIACWAEDAEWSLMGMTLSGKAVIRGAWEQAMAGFPLAAFFGQPGAIEVSGDRAAVRVYTQEVLTTPDGGLRRVVGRYDDTLTRVNGQWLFARRVYTILNDRSEAA